MKKLLLVVALATLGGWAINSYADVQNIRLSGDIRTRGYFIDNAGGSSSEQVSGGASFVSQRTRVTVEADLEDHVLVVVTLQAEGLWGSEDQVTSASGAGTGPSGGDPHEDFPNNNKLSKGWDVGVTEAYVQLNEVFYTPATLKIGRQYLNYGRGLILSSYDQEYNYDAARLVLDYYPLTIDLVGSMIDNDQGYTSTANHDEGLNMLFLNARYEMSDSLVKDVEVYFGWLAQHTSDGLEDDDHIPPVADTGASPWIVGLRSDMNITEDLAVWVEGAYEGGADGFAGSEGLSAYIVNGGGRYTFKDMQWSPVANFNYTFASGGGQEAGGQFRPWFDYVDGYNGYLFAPALSNIHIFNLGVSSKPAENLTMSLQVYYYLKADKDSIAGSNGNVDFGGLDFGNIFSGDTANSRELGWEIDQVISYDYSKDVRMQLVNATFIPGGAFSNLDTYGAKVAREIRAELNVKF